MQRLLLLQLLLRLLLRIPVAMMQCGMLLACMHAAVPVSAAQLTLQCSILRNTAITAAIVIAAAAAAAASAML
jgi:hypothetical protein